MAQADQALADALAGLGTGLQAALGRTVLVAAIVGLIVIGIVMVFR